MHLLGKAENFAITEKKGALDSKETKTMAIVWK